MNILHITPYYAPAYAFGGVTRAVEGMARALIQKGHTVTILTTDAYTQTARLDDSAASDNAKPRIGQWGEMILRVPNRSVWLRGRANLSTPLGIRRVACPLLKAADVVHVHEFRTLENLLLTPLAARMGKPLLLSPHGTLTRSTGRSLFKTLWDSLLSPAVARRFHGVIGLTSAEVDDARALWATLKARSQFFVVPNGIEPDEFAHLPDPAPFRAKYGLGDAVICLFMGRLHRRKGVEVLVRAFKRAAVPNTRLVLAGPDDGMLPTLQPLLDERIIVTGYLSGEERLRALAAADVFALPATGEGLSMAALEAMGAGLPVILSPGCNLPEAEEAGAGVIVPPETEPLTAALSTLLTDTERRAMMGAAGRALVRERFTWKAVAEGLEAAYRAVLW